MDNIETSTNVNANKPKKSLMPIAIIIAGVLIAGAIVYAGYTNFFGATPAKDAAAKAINFINTTLLGGKETVTLKTVSNESGVYKITFDYQGKETVSYITKNAKLFFPGGFSLVAPSPTPTPTDQAAIGNFLAKANANVCLDNAKPIVNFFGSKACPHCVWEEPIIQGVAAKFASVISFKEDITPDLKSAFKDPALFAQYDTNGQIPLIVIGCKYYRVGSGESLGNDTEAKNLTALFCKITGNKPAAVCAAVTDIINQIKN